MAAAMHLAEVGEQVVLLESGPAIGGSMHLLDHTFPTNSCGLCLMLPRAAVATARRWSASGRAGMRLLPYSELVGVEGEEGAYRARVRHKARYVDVDKCDGCGRVRGGMPGGAAARPRGVAVAGEGDLPAGGAAGGAGGVGGRHGVLHALRAVRGGVPAGRDRPGHAGVGGRARGRGGAADAGLRGVRRAEEGGVRVRGVPQRGDVAGV